MYEAHVATVKKSDTSDFTQIHEVDKILETSLSVTQNNLTAPQTTAKMTLNST